MHHLTAYNYTFLRKIYVPENFTSMLCTWEFHGDQEVVLALDTSPPFPPLGLIWGHCICPLSIDSASPLMDRNLQRQDHWTGAITSREKTSRTRRGMLYANLPMLVRTSSHNPLVQKEICTHFKYTAHAYMCARARAHVHTHTHAYSTARAHPYTCNHLLLFNINIRMYTLFHAQIQTCTQINPITGGHSYIVFKPFFAGVALPSLELKTRVLSSSLELRR